MRSAALLVRGDVDECSNARHGDHHAADRIQHGENLELALALEIRHEIELPDQIGDQRDIGQQRKVVKQKSFQPCVQR